MDNYIEFMLFFPQDDNTSLHGSKVKIFFIEGLFSLVNRKEKVWGLLRKNCRSIKFTFIPMLALRLWESFLICYDANVFHILQTLQGCFFCQNCEKCPEGKQESTISLQPKPPASSLDWTVEKMSVTSPQDHSLSNVLFKT